VSFVVKKMNHKEHKGKNKEHQGRIETGSIQTKWIENFRYLSNQLVQPATCIAAIAIILIKALSIPPRVRNT